MKTTRKTKSNIYALIFILIVLAMIFLASFKGFILLKSIRHQNQMQDADKVYVRLNQKIILSDAYNNKYEMIYYEPMDNYFYQLPEGENITYQCEGDSTTLGSFQVKGTATTISILGLNETVKYQTLEIC